ncbi:MAG: hypothetical protein LBL20_00135, partial [Treponema sp.]|nr:hypothetical protein [Treponema sp.]
MKSEIGGGGQKGEKIPGTAYFHATHGYTIPPVRMESRPIMSEKPVNMADIHRNVWVAERGSGTPISKLAKDNKRVKGFLKKNYKIRKKYL